MYFPIMVDITKKKIVIVGGGKIGYRKAKEFLEFGGEITALSPKFIREFYQLENKYGDKINLIKDYYKKEYIDKSFMVIGATSLRDVNQKISIDCKNLGILCNIVDNKEESSFISSSIVNKDGLIVTVSTMGKFPYLSKKVKEDVGQDYLKFSNEYMELLEGLRKIVLLKYKNRSEEIFNYAIKLNIQELKNFIEKLEDENTYREAYDEGCSRNKGE